LTKVKCLACGKPALNGFTHSRCKTKYSPERVLSAVPFHYPWREILHTLKFRGGLGTVSLIKDLLLLWRAETGVELPKDFEIVPIPLHWVRFHSRDYNQAEEIAKALAEVFEIKLSAVSMIRIISTNPQSKLEGKEDRVRNIKGAFKIKEKDKSRIEGKRFLLVDDVITSGATMLEAARTLKHDGAAEVWCFGLAQA
jgi:ComF family protein